MRPRALVYFYRRRLRAHGDAGAARGGRDRGRGRARVRRDCRQSSIAGSAARSRARGRSGRRTCSCTRVARKGFGERDARAASNACPGVEQRRAAAGRDRDGRPAWRQRDRPRSPAPTSASRAGRARAHAAARGALAGRHRPERGERERARARRPSAARHAHEGDASDLRGQASGCVSAPCSGTKPPGRSPQARIAVMPLHACSSLPACRAA